MFNYNLTDERTAKLVVTVILEKFTMTFNLHERQSRLKTTFQFFSSRILHSSCINNRRLEATIL